MTATGVCDECGYNLPHHDDRCSAATPLTFLCPDHAPSRSADNDDSLVVNPCATCATPTRKGYRL